MRLIASLIIISVIIAAIGGGVYLYFAYAHIYNFMGEINLTKPVMPGELIIKSQARDKTGGRLLRYVAMGDSLTAGVGSQDYHNSFPYLLAKRFSKTGDIELGNLGAPGALVADVLSNQVFPTIGFKPDIVTLLIGINDVHQRTGIKYFKADLEEILAALTAKTKAKIIVINIPYLGAGSLILPPYRYYFERETKKYNAVIKTAAAAAGVCFVDLHDQSRELFAGNPGVYSADLFHPADYGYQLWSEIIYAHIDCPAS